MVHCWIYRLALFAGLCLGAIFPHHLEHARLAQKMLTAYAADLRLSYLSILRSRSTATPQAALVPFADLSPLIITLASVLLKSPDNYVRNASVTKRTRHPSLFLQL